VTTEHTVRWRVPTRVAVAAVLATVVILPAVLVTVLRDWRLEAAEWGLWAVLALTLGVALAAGPAAAVGVARRRGRSLGRGTLRAIVIVAVALGVAGTTPVLVDVDDGCNTGSDLVPLVVAPWAGDGDAVGYGGSRTLRQCLP